MIGFFLVVVIVAGSDKCQQFTVGNNVQQSCQFSDVSFDGAKWSLSPTSSILEGPFTNLVEKVNLGTYDTSPAVVFKKASKPFACKSIQTGNTIYYHAPNPRYYHWLLDDLLGLWWMKKFHQITSPIK